MGVPKPERRRERQAVWEPVVKLMRERHLTFRWLACEIGLDYHVLMNMRLGYQITQRPVWVAVCRALGVPEWEHVPLPERVFRQYLAG
jgi:hypothetical protein